MGLRDHIEEAENEAPYSWALYFEEMQGVANEFETDELSAEAALCQMREVHEHAKAYGLPLPEFFITLETLKEFK